MGDEEPINRLITDRERLPAMFPTHSHKPEFWEHLGRAIASFGFLEEVLGKAIFSFTGTRQYNENEIGVAYKAWLPTLEKALSGQLVALADAYNNAARDNPATTIDNVPELVENIKAAAIIRNVLCHGSWRGPDVNGASIPFFVNKKKEIFVTPIDVAYLRQVQQHVAELSCCVIDTVTHMGWQFPGSVGLGKPIWSNDKESQATT
ncbi:MAG: hypothetical protein WD046_00245 [Paracoccaceae bacterium]